MGSAYTPGLTVSDDVTIRRIRRLPIKGQVLVKVGDKVEPDSHVAQALLPGLLQTIKLAEKLGVEPKDVQQYLLVKEGDPVSQSQMVAETKGLFGKFFKGQVVSEYVGTVESISEVAGHMFIREPSIPVEITVVIQGSIVGIMVGDGAVVEFWGGMVQGIFGVGPESHGTIRVAVSGPDQLLEASHLQESDNGKIVVGGSGLTLEAIQRASELGVVGLIAGGVRDVDLTKFLGYDIGVAITGQENINTTIIVTEGFGRLTMAMRTFDLFKSLDGRFASINGATQIRAGVIRPEVVISRPELTGASAAASQAMELKIGTPIRVIREPYFGQIGSVVELPTTLQVLDSGTEVRVLKAKLEDGALATVPRANVEIIAT